MEFDWIDPTFDTTQVTPREVEESFEDPFSLRLLPEEGYGEEHARYVCLGTTLNNRPLFTVFWTDGKKARAIVSREMSADERSFYDLKNAEQL